MDEAGMGKDAGVRERDLREIRRACCRALSTSAVDNSACDWELDAGGTSAVDSEVEAREEVKSSSVVADADTLGAEVCSVAPPARGAASTAEPASQRWSPRACSCRDQRVSL